MPLNSKQKRLLKSLGQTMPDDCLLGKAGVNDAFVKNVQSLLARQELVKLRFTDTQIQGAMRKELARDVCAVLDAECVGVVGRTILLYKGNPNLAPDARVLD